MGVNSYNCFSDNTRLDKFLAGKIREHTRGYIQKLIVKGYVSINGVTVIKPSYKLKSGSMIAVKEMVTEKLEINPLDYDLEIIYEDDSIAVVNKPAGIVVHPGKGNWEGTLVHILAGKISNLSGIGGVERPGIVHRLDKDTSGVMLVAKNDLSHNKIADAFKNREIDKTYIAVCYGIISSNRGCIEGAIKRDSVSRMKMKVTEAGETGAGKYCATYFEVIENYRGAATALKVKPLTGRTHQIRASLMETGHPIVGDKVYKRKDLLEKYKSLRFVKRQMLHAYSIRFTHPENDKKMYFKAEIPEDMLWAIDSVESFNHDIQIEDIK